MSDERFPRLIQEGDPPKPPKKPRYLPALVRAWVVIIIGLACLGVVIAVIVTAIIH